MTATAILAKAGGILLTNEDARRRIGWVLVAVLSPIILLIVFLCSLASGTANHNLSAVELCFYDGTIPASAPEEYRTYIEDMRSSFDLQDGFIAAINEQAEETSLDNIRVKAAFFALYFGADSPSRKDHKQFADCFVTYEERTRTVTSINENGDEVESEETYTVAIPMEDMEQVYQNIRSVMGIEVTADQQINADSIYSLIRYGYTGGSGFSGSDVPFIGADGFCSPVGENWRSMVTSEFGYRSDPFTGQVKGHSGIDLAVPTGTPIRAALPGTVTVSSYNQGGYGYYIMIDHGTGLVTLYGHCSRLLASVGRTVEAGDVIALSGSTGRSTGPHLHFEVRVNGERVNPRSYLP